MQPPGYSFARNLANIASRSLAWKSAVAFNLTGNPHQLSPDDFHDYCNSIHHELMHWAIDAGDPVADRLAHGNATWLCVSNGVANFWRDSEQSRSHDRQTVVLETRNAAIFGSMKFKAHGSIRTARSPRKIDVFGYGRKHARRSKQHRARPRPKPGMEDRLFTMIECSTELQKMGDVQKTRQITCLDRTNGTGASARAICPRIRVNGVRRRVGGNRLLTRIVG